MLLALSVPAAAQQPGKGYRIGFLSGFSQAWMASNYAAFQQGLRELGYVEGQNVILESRYVEGNVALLPELAAELVRSKVDIIVAVSDPAVRAAKHVTTTIPIVMVNVGTDPVETGMVESLARPGGNITGLVGLGVEMADKRLELFKEAFPTLARVAHLYDPANQGNVIEVKVVQSAAHALGLAVQAWEVRGTDAFERVFAALREERPDGLFVPGGPLMNANVQRIVDFALKSRLPSMYVSGASVKAGGLISYGSDTVYQYRHRVASYVDKILKGTRPADLPVEQPTKFELVINLKTAKALGITVPPSLLLLADEVIQ